MMPEEWPIAAPAADRNAPARDAGRGRLATVRADFFLDPAERLTEQERALMTAMLHGLVGEIADEIRAELPPGLIAANDQANAAVIDALTRAGLLNDANLMALLLRRADEERIAAGTRSRNGRHEARALQALVSHGDGSVSAAAMALVLARGRRRDRFGQCLVAFDDLSDASAMAVAHAAAAALRCEIAAAQDSAGADLEFAGAAERILERRQSERSLDSLTAALVRELDEAGALGDDLVLAAALDGEAGFLAEVLGRRAGIAAKVALDELQSGDSQRLMALLRLSGLSRDFSARLLAAIGDLLGIADPGSAIDAFDRMTEEQAKSAGAWLRAPTEYRTALVRLGDEGRGQRAL